MGTVWLAKATSGRVGYEHDLGAEIPVSEGFNRYTTVVYPNNTFSEYINGTLQTWVGNNGVSSIASPNTPWMGLILSYGLRENSSGFTSGSRNFDIRSLAVYQDAKHAGQNIEDGGIAPGTTIAGEAPSEEEHKEPPKQEPPTEEHKQAPAESLPQTPSNFTAVSLKTSVKLSYQADPAEDHVSEYRLYRAGSNQPGHAAGSPWASNPATALSFANNTEVEPGMWICYRLAAVNKKGESPKTAPHCVNV